jgi:hypothetical protein
MVSHQPKKDRRLFSENKILRLKAATPLMGMALPLQKTLAPKSPKHTVKAV